MEVDIPQPFFVPAQKRARSSSFINYCGERPLKRTFQGAEQTIFHISDNRPKVYPKALRFQQESTQTMTAFTANGIIRPGCDNDILMSTDMDMVDSIPPYVEIASLDALRLTPPSQSIAAATLTNHAYPILPSTGLATSTTSAPAVYDVPIDSNLQAPVSQPLATPARKPRMVMGPRAGCEKCIAKVPGHWMHFD
ncbi:hypothetical protein BOTBODRAFT_52475 [Botryobasidium botryosum FD-172 SS1]|uniref:Uncharacterized protein n=1 Tax=Botryobasidium botryosum (strain FD-172 SS1) TaxID=930990 RepID=A0A067MS83_BOTB1|nr:hypothetical protein BOTBODRAFT_52475 [Botryobasidium botryosum FD-172 SS1]